MSATNSDVSRQVAAVAVRSLDRFYPQAPAVDLKRPRSGRYPVKLNAAAGGVAVITARHATSQHRAEKLFGFGV